jgi:hypothetical protein
MESISLYALLTSGYLKICLLFLFNKVPGADLKSTGTLFFELSFIGRYIGLQLSVT